MSQRETIRSQTTPQKRSVMLVKFTTDDGATTYRVTDHVSPVDLFGDLYASLPKMEVDLASNTGGLNDNPHGITMPVNSFTQSFSIGEAHPFIDIEIREKIIGEVHSSAEIVFEGRATRSIRNYNGSPSAVRINATTWKSRMQVPLGIQANPGCIWTFTGRGCELAPTTGLETNRQIIDVDKQTVTFASLAAPADDGRYRRGYVEINGLRIGIREHTTALGTSVILVREPPRSWLGRTGVIVKAGCDKNIVTCRTRWSNEDQFMGCGFAIPKYHPVVETQ